MRSTAKPHFYLALIKHSVVDIIFFLLSFPLHSPILLLVGPRPFPLPQIVEIEKKSKDPYYIICLKRSFVAKK
ncbi:hypothetical protein V6N11_030135 [Hibiscus sabdariffa]|uniref:Uncharacterized protein n=1 Tax=Hibiscus sabdariffa TaxID=183260 RepID=A0ABR2PKA4_9ROSI